MELKSHKEQAEKQKIRQPIITVCGHVDHGKTSVLDRIRQTSVYETEAGGITQKISFTKYPIEQIKCSCPLIEKSKVKLEIPGFLFIDTPGHAAFTHLRKRGGSLADLAIVVVAIKEGRTIFKNIRKFISERFDRVQDYTKQVAIVPCSARTKEGISELLFMLCGLCQRFLKERLKVGNDAKGIILEVKKEKNAEYIESILYDGELKENDMIAIATFNDVITSKIRAIEEIQPLSLKYSPIK